MLLLSYTKSRHRLSQTTNILLFIENTLYWRYYSSVFLFGTVSFMPLQLDDATKKLVKSYTLVYMIVFVLGVPLLAFTMSVVVFITLQSHAYTLSSSGMRSTSLVAKEKQIITTVETVHKKTFSWQDISVILANGFFQQNNNTIVSVDNLITYKWLLLPRMATIQTILPLQDKKFFSQPNYDVRELDRYMKDIIFWPLVVSADTQQKNELLPIPWGRLLPYFSLDCLEDTKLSSAICDYYVVWFLDSMHAYDLSQDYDWLQLIFDGIKGTPKYRNIFCTNLQAYISYARDVSPKIAGIMDMCGGEVAHTYDLLRSFFVVQADMKEMTPSVTVFPDKNINAYKLISLQQQIFLEISKKRLNQPRIAVYLQFVEELLKKDAIEHVYKDIAFLFNNAYLASVLSSPSFNTSLSKKEEVKLLQQKIRSVNEGSELKGYVWLQKQLFNGQLAVLLQDKDSSVGDMQTTGITLIERFNAKFSFDALRILEQQQIGEQVSVYGRLAIGHPEEMYTVRLLFSNYMGSFIIDQIDFVDMTGKLNETLQAIVSKNKFTLPQIYDYLVKNMTLLNSEQPEVTLCDKLIKAITAISGCNDQQIDVQVMTKSWLIVYSFAHISGQVTHLYLTDKERWIVVWDKFSGVQTNELSISDYIQEVITYDPPAAPVAEIPNDVSQAERMAIDDRLNTYLGISSTAIMKKDTQTLVMFTLQGIEFIAMYDIPTSTIVQLFFKKVWPGQWFTKINLLLDSTNIDILDQFTKDPLVYLETLDPKLVLLYRKS